MRTLDKSGNRVKADDPKRMLWYGPCGFWTDDWDKLKVTPIPCCPHCGSPGFQIEYSKWDSGAEVFERTHPRYT